MKKVNLRWRWLLRLLLTVCWLVPAGLRAQEADTARLTWTAAAGETKSFSFEGAAGALYVLQWGDGQTTYVTATGGMDQVTHAYAQAGAYDVLLRDGNAVEAVAASMAMVYVEGGTFQMGATSEQGNEAYDNEKPVHKVTLDGFYIGKYEVTQSQWYAVMGTNPCSGSSYGVGDNYPVYYVSWNDAVEFCEKLSAQTGKTYRLPTEAEWEYAARGGNKADGTKYAGGNTIGEVAWYYDNSYGLGSSHPDYGTHPVGTKKANGLGIYDMSGNVGEWCSDWYGNYSSSSAVNPQGPVSGSYRVYRGGSWSNRARNCRVSLRDFDYPGGRGHSLGFRVVCER